MGDENLLVGQDTPLGTPSYVDSAHYRQCKCPWMLLGRSHPVVECEGSDTLFVNNGFLGDPLPWYFSSIKGGSRRVLRNPSAKTEGLQRYI